MQEKRKFLDNIKRDKEALKELRKSVNVILELYGEAMSAIITGENALPENAS